MPTSQDSSLVWRFTPNSGYAEVLKALTLGGSRNLLQELGALTLAKPSCIDYTVRWSWTTGNLEWSRV